ncbi:ABC transporter ATP-binding protein [Thiomonas sp. FB-6]|uniref:ABC transporter ATP-binding protein n=1 Tax=Thiomonas sp. FB-6 TaxID=1158291 RepID=UPI00037ECEAD|nr:ABC transporter ATP-binding protein [Thiomonas sp. FB-6]
MDTEALIEFDQVEAGYGNLRVLHKASFRAREGLITLLTGANGAGKSTAMKTLFGVIRPTSGDVRLRGRSIVGRTPRDMLELGMSYVPQDRSLFPSLSVYHNLELGGIMLPRKQLRPRIEEVLERFPRLRERVQSQASTLSGGERKQLEIARALLLRPDILLVDEPSIGLSPKIVGEVFDLLGRLAADGKTILVVEQNVRSALKVAHHAYGMELGRIVLDLPADSILDNPEFNRLLLGGHVADAA